MLWRRPQALVLDQGQASLEAAAQELLSQHLALQQSRLMGLVHDSK